MDNPSLQLRTFAADHLQPAFAERVFAGDPDAIRQAEKLMRATRSELRGANLPRSGRQ